MKTNFLKRIRAQAILRILAVVGLLITLICVPQRAVRAATVRLVKPDGVTFGTCTTWADACTLQRALSVAAAGDEVWVKAGTYFPTSGTSRSATFQLKNDVAIYGGFFGDETHKNNRNPTANVTILSGEIGGIHATDNSYHVVTGSYTDHTAGLDGFTITGGNADGTGDDGNGGGIFNHSGSPTLVRIIFSGNSAQYGGGMFNGVSSPTLNNITFSNNIAVYGGGGMYDGGNSTPAMTNINFVSNSAGSGGGMYNTASSPILSNVTFNNNDAGTGGGMYNASNSNLSLTYVTFTANTGDNGGGVRNSDSSPTINNTTFINNTANSGGGMDNYTSSPALNNVTFSSNTSSSQGGGMHNWQQSQPVLINVTFSGNSAGAGGGMSNSNSSNPTIKNSIFWGNTATVYNPQINNFDLSAPVVTYSDIQGGYIGEGNISADPLLGSLGIYGGSMQVFPLLPGSAAIDAGNDATCASIDARGISRPQGSYCDMGAFESRGFTLAATGGGNQNAVINAAFAQPLAVSVSSTNSEPVNGGSLSVSAPVSGPSAVLSAVSLTITAGAASVTVTANGIPGGYNVTAFAAGIASPVIFHLTNDYPPGSPRIYLPLIIR
jgi:hypothetical protein